MQKSAKFILPLLLTAALLIGFTGCADKNETPTNPPQSCHGSVHRCAHHAGHPASTGDADRGLGRLRPHRIPNKEHLSVTLNLTADLTAQDTILYQDGSKYAELVGVIVPAKDQTAFDNLELNKDYNGVEYKEKGTGTLPNGTRYTYIMSDLPTETGSWYAYCYALPAGDNLLLLTLYKTEKQAALSPADAALLQSAGWDNQRQFTALLPHCNSDHSLRYATFAQDLGAFFMPTGTGL